MKSSNSARSILSISLVISSSNKVAVAVFVRSVTAVGDMDGTSLGDSEGPSEGESLGEVDGTSEGVNEGSSLG